MSQQPLVVSSSMPTRTYTSRLENLERISQFIVQQARLAGLSEAEIYQVELAVDEAATNIIEHAYGGNTRLKIHCTCELLDDGLKVVLQDYAKPFDPTSVPDPVIGMPIEDLPPRGLGIFLIRKMMDEVSYRFNKEEGNVLIMVKRKQG